jgi:hypothetical protein
MAISGYLLSLFPQSTIIVLIRAPNSPPISLVGHSTPLTRPPTPPASRPILSVVTGSLPPVLSSTQRSDQSVSFTQTMSTSTASQSTLQSTSTASQSTLQSISTEDQSIPQSVRTAGPPTPQSTTDNSESISHESSSSQRSSSRSVLYSWQSSSELQWSISAEEGAVLRELWQGIPTQLSTHSTPPPMQRCLRTSQSQRVMMSGK